MAGQRAVEEIGGIALAGELGRQLRELVGAGIGKQALALVAIDPLGRLGGEFVQVLMICCTGVVLDAAWATAIFWTAC